MRILAIGDIHAKLSALEEIKLLNQIVLSKIKELGIDAVVILGDMSDQFEKMHLQTWNVILQFMKTVSEQAPVYYIVGNHDLVHHTAYGTQEHYFNAFKIWNNIKVIDSIEVIDLGGHKVVMAPYLAPGELIKQYQELQIDGIHAVFSHQEYYGSQLGAILSTVGDQWPSDYPQVFNGHIHDRSRPYPNVLNVGTPRYTSFGETLPRSLSLIEIGDTVIETPIPIHMPRKQTIRVDVNSFSELDIDPQPMDFYRLVVNGLSSEIEILKKGKKFKEYSKLDNVKIVLKPVPEQRVQKNTANNTFDQILFDKCQSSGVNNVLEELIREYQTEKFQTA